MSSEIQIRLLQAIEACLRPLVRMLVRSGISYRQFDEIVKTVFVRESLTSIDQPKRRTNVSRIAVRTGISRKEVARIRDSIASPGGFLLERESGAFHTSQAARVLQIWHSDDGFVDDVGRPKDLEFDQGDTSFSALVRRVGGDIPSGAVRAELLSAGAIEEVDGGKLRALKRHFIPGDLGEEMVVGFAHIVSPMLGALAHNCQAPKSDAYFQRVAYSDSMMATDLPALRAFASTQAATFMHKIDDWLGENEQATTSASEHRPRVGVGVFYFEEEESRKDG